MQQLGCESHSVTCVSCYVHVYGNKVIISCIETYLVMKDCMAVAVGTVHNGNVLGPKHNL